ncbi:MAG: flavodoxin domain-containing protein [Leptotrichiaceae bacterium]|nr:flavodoxin domain-containing protein [Leptotrichiaceae bacterium]MBP7725035.1 flavodoxin domain-containing protein [Leptotrichiaceae bacterium]MBP9629604.1 flavodoxin domain-containing protein [Leptotrichiaceae bacterium]
MKKLGTVGIIIGITIFNLFVKTKNNIIYSKDNRTSKRILVVYHSETGATEKVAKMIQQKLGADILKIEPVVAYDTKNLSALKSLVTKQQREKTKVAIKSPNKSVSNYDVILIGTPAWFSKVSPPMESYIESQNFSNKTVAMFTTYDGVYGNVLMDFEKNVKAKEVKKGMAFSGSQIRNGIDKDLNTWLNNIK